MLSVFSYIVTLLGILCYMALIDGEVGVLMLAFFLLFPVLSLLLTLYGARHILLSVQLQPMTPRDAAAELSTQAEKNTWVPLPFLRYAVVPDAHFTDLETPVQLALSSVHSIQKKHMLTARVCGTGYVTIERPRLVGFFAFCQCPLHTTTRAKIQILPQIPEMTANNELFQAVSSNTMVSEDEASDMTPVLGGLNTIAGYSHRVYQPGDPLKRINWKLSSKKEDLMVRLDEALAIAKTSVLLDFQRKPCTELNLDCFLREQTITEGALGLLSLCAEQGLGCNFYHLAGNGWQETVIESANQVVHLSTNVLDTGFSETISLRIPPQFALNRQNGVFLVFTTTPDDQLFALCQTLQGTVHVIVPTGTPCRVPKAMHLWMITTDYRIIPANAAPEKT